ncbi:hypothetical protein L2Y96_11835 [Luteibacter aegosomaticola]|uniref:hypothetical protein n=1 Tax=Luteibacter aegosomaticola TaxID=2911538 RepID=UPI001FF95731|nr:hypothetical protein [Luteibacter aegosomaticola]UPG88110.1 hypothetical protein L2Y96_11835 [Luteibacter aegosomaticola]
MKTAALIALGLALVGTATWAMSDTHAAALSATAPAAQVVAADSAKGILPYGAMNHVAAPATAAILPYGAMNAAATTTTEAIPPYGVMHQVAMASSASILPYGGATGIHAAP